MIWEYVFIGKGEAPCSVFSNKLIFSQQSESTLDVICFDLGNKKMGWMQKFIGDSNSFPRLDFGSQYELPHDKENVIISGRIACHIIDINSGSVKFTVNWKSYLKNEQVSNFKLENYLLYINDFSNNSNDIICIDVQTNKTVWKLKDASFIGIYKGYVIGYSSEVYYLVTEKLTGILKDKIFRPHERQTAFGFLHNYILINHDVIYK